MITYGPDAEDLVAAASEYNQSLPAPFEHVHPMVEPADVIGDGAEGRGLDPELRNKLRGVLLSASIGIFGAVYVSSPESFGSPVARELAYAELWRAGASVICGGEPVDPDNLSDSVTAVLRPEARSGARLYAILRAHDQHTILDEEATLAAARQFAMKLRARGYTLERIADRLNEEAFPTRRRTGAWSGSAVGEILR